MIITKPDSPTENKSTLRPFLNRDESLQEEGKTPHCPPEQPLPSLIPTTPPSLALLPSPKTSPYPIPLFPGCHPH